MGSITSHPAIPAAAQTVYVPIYTPVTSTATGSGATAPTADNTSTGSSTTTPDTSTAAAIQNTSLLDRSRGVLSTVVTGFRGLLSDTNNTPQRKTLLGE